MTVLFLYTELADYFLQCCIELSGSAEVHVVRWPVNKEAPFEFRFPDNLKVYNRRDYNLSQLQALAERIAPDLLVCSGWVDKDYLKIAGAWHKKIPTILTCDTHWKGTLKQYVATVLSRIFLLNKFSHAWVPGRVQENYVRKLGFTPAQIKKGFYCCNLNTFNALYARIGEERARQFPKKFLYVGRYYEFKGIRDLWQAFASLYEEGLTDWELWCLGTGDIEPIQHPAIRHFGFVQPHELEPIIRDCGVFVLPSHFEPWGVVAQEYAAAGFPLLLSSEVGAAETFLEDGKNGFLFESANANALKATLKKIMNLHSKDLLLMSEISHTLAQRISPASWVSVLLEIQHEFKSN